MGRLMRFSVSAHTASPGTPLAASVNQVGSASDAKMVGSEVELDAIAILEMTRTVPDSAQNRTRPISERFDPDKVLTEANRIAKTLFKSIEAYHVQPLGSPFSMVVANYAHASVSSSATLVEGQIVQARFKNARDTWSRTWHGATVEAVEEDGSSADLTYDDSDKGSVAGVCSDYIRDKTVQHHEVTSNEIMGVRHEVCRCTHCRDAALGSLTVNKTVEARHAGKARWFRGEITRCHLDDSYDIDYGDGKTESHVKPSLIREGCFIASCAVCEAARALCATCRRAGFNEWRPQRRPCWRCFALKLSCKRCEVMVLGSDKEHTKALINLTKEGSELHGKAWPVFLIQHALKGACGPVHNWYLKVGDDVVCITDLNAFWTQPYIPLLKIITKEVLIRKVGLCGGGQCGSLAGHFDSVALLLPTIAGQAQFFTFRDALRAQGRRTHHAPRRGQSHLARAVPPMASQL